MVSDYSFKFRHRHVEPLVELTGNYSMSFSRISKFLDPSASIMSRIHPYFNSIISNIMLKWKKKTHRPIDN